MFGEKKINLVLDEEEALVLSLLFHLGASTLRGDLESGMVTIRVLENLEKDLIRLGKGSVRAQIRKISAKVDLLAGELGK